METKVVDDIILYDLCLDNVWRVCDEEENELIKLVILADVQSN
jgi:hypothetical protein